MDDNLDKIISRRSFLRSGTCAALGLTGLTSQIFSMRAMGALLDNKAFNDYRALVCIFLFGGNDSGNTLIPWANGDEDYAAYAANRTTLAISQSDLASHVISPNNTNGRQFAMHPSLSGLREMFNQGNVSLVSNVGTLVQPTTRSQYRNKLVTLPPQLFGHNTQQLQWQLSRPNVADGLGWGGSIADVLQANGANANSSVSMNISLAGRSNFLSGRNIEGYSVGTGGPSSLNLRDAGDNAISTQAFLDMIAIHQDSSHPASTPMGKVLSDVTVRSVANGGLINTLLDEESQITLSPPSGNGLASQLQMVARLMEFGRSGLGHDRQIFFVSMGGYDNHSGLLGDTPTNGPHGLLLTQLNNAMVHFWQVLGEIGMQNNVTTFTASDFGRTYRSNGNGSDHGWGGHHIVMGGNHLRGSRIFGQYPSVVLGGEADSSSGGQFIPTTSVDEYGFEMARWMGVPLSDMATVFPNIANFIDVYNPNSYLGLLNA